MANTQLGLELTQLHRRQQLALRSATLRDLLLIWPLFDLDDIDGSWPAVEAALLALVAERHRTSAGLASSYYRTFRAAERARGAFDPPSPPPLDRTMARATLALLGPIAAKKAIAKRRPKVAEDTLTRLSGSVGRQVLDGGRQTLQQAVKADPQAKGWRRVAASGACDFCKAIADRGIVGDDVDFQAHDHCGCTQEPSFEERITSRFGPTPAPGAFNDFLERFGAEVAQRSGAQTSPA